jgi:hypothetical protein
MYLYLTNARNTFAFFEVTPTSHHQVQEVYGSRERVSISGWFHGPKSSVALPIFENNLLTKWINPAYLVCKNALAISKSMVIIIYVRAMHLLLSCKNF